MAPQPAAANVDDEVEEGVSVEAAQRLGVIATSAPMQTGTLAGDLRDTLLDLFKTRPKSWFEMKEDEQMEIGRMLEYAARELVIGVVEVVRSDSIVEPVRAILEGYTDKGDIKGTIKVKTMNEGDAELAISTLHRMRGKMVLISIASHEDYLGERGPVETDPDQNGMEFAEVD